MKSTVITFKHFSFLNHNNYIFNLVLISICHFFWIPTISSQQKFLGMYSEKVLDLKQDFDLTSDRITGLWYAIQINSRKSPQGRCVSFEIHRIDEYRTAHVDIHAVETRSGRWMVFKGKLSLSPTAEKSGLVHWRFLGQNWKSQLITTDYTQYLILRSLVRQTQNYYEEMLTVYSRSRNPDSSILDQISKEIEKMGLSYLHMIPVSQVDCDKSEKTRKSLPSLLFPHSNRFKVSKSAISV